MKTHLTVRPGGRRKFSIHSVLHELSQNLSSFHVLCTVFSFFKMKITYKIKEVTEHGLYLKYSFYAYIVYNKQEISGELDFPSCLLEFIDDFVQGFPT